MGLMKRIRDMFKKEDVQVVEQRELLGKEYDALVLDYEAMNKEVSAADRYFETAEPDQIDLAISNLKLANEKRAFIHGKIKKIEAEIALIS